MVTRSPGALPTIGKRTGERPDQKAASPSHSQERPSLVVSDCISAPSGETSTAMCRLAMRTVSRMEFPLLGQLTGMTGRTITQPAVYSFAVIGMLAESRSEEHTSELQSLMRH